jgi:hypothetical protein
MEHKAKATVALRGGTITFEGSEEFVAEQVSVYSASVSSRNDIKHGDSPARSDAGTTNAIAERELLEQKRPRGHHEIATVLAWALTEAGTPEFTEEDIRRAYLRAGVRPPKYVAQALRDAKSKFDFVTTGSKRGTYRLTNHGDRTVRFDMPRQ